MGDYSMVLWATGFLQNAAPTVNAPRDDDFERWCADARPLTFEEWLSVQPIVFQVGA